MTKKAESLFQDLLTFKVTKIPKTKRQKYGMNETKPPNRYPEHFPPFSGQDSDLAKPK